MAGLEQLVPISSTKECTKECTSLITQMADMNIVIMSLAFTCDSEEVQYIKGV